MHTFSIAVSGNCARVRTMASPKPDMKDLEQALSAAEADLMLTRVLAAPFAIKGLYDNGADTMRPAAAFMSMLAMAATACKEEKLLPENFPMEVFDLLSTSEEVDAMAVEVFTATSISEVEKLGKRVGRASKGRTSEGRFEEAESTTTTSVFSKMSQASIAGKPLGRTQAPTGSPLDYVMQLPKTLETYQNMGGGAIVIVFVLSMPFFYDVAALWARELPLFNPQDKRILVKRYAQLLRKNMRFLIGFAIALGYYEAEVRLAYDGPDAPATWSSPMEYYRKTLIEKNTQWAGDHPNALQALRVQEAWFNHTQSVGTIPHFNKLVGNSAPEENWKERYYWTEVAGREPPVGVFESTLTAGAGKLTSIKELAREKAEDGYRAYLYSFKKVAAGGISELYADAMEQLAEPKPEGVVTSCTNQDLFRTNITIWFNKVGADQEFYKNARTEHTGWLIVAGVWLSWYAFSEHKKLGSARLKLLVNPWFLDELVDMYNALNSINPRAWENQNNDVQAQITAAGELIVDLARSRSIALIPDRYQLHYYMRILIDIRQRANDRRDNDQGQVAQLDAQEVDNILVDLGDMRNQFNFVRAPWPLMQIEAPCNGGGSSVVDHVFATAGL